MGQPKFPFDFYICGKNPYLGTFAQLANSHHLVAEDALVFWFVSDSSHLQKCPLSSFSSDTHIKFVRARGGIVVKALRNKPAGRRFDSQWCH